MKCKLVRYFESKIKILSSTRKCIGSSYSGIDRLSATYGQAPICRDFFFFF